MACELYRGWVGDVFRRLQPLRPAWRIVGYFSGGNESDFAAWADMTDVWRPQPAGDLGARLERAFGAEILPGDSAPAGNGVRLAIGTDCLDIGPDVIAAAAAALATAETVFGPATDGGYYLTGLKRPAPRLFDAVRWSAPQTLADQLDRCRALGLSHALLPTLADIDTEEDWRAWQAAKR